MRSKILDLMKSVGIILVVIGHCTKNMFLKRFIYLFHLPLFFLISGYLYNEKSCIEPWNYVSKKLKKFVLLYALYGSFLVVFRNIFIKMGIMDGILYKFDDILVFVFSSFLFQSYEPFSAAMWFIPVLLVSLIIYNFITSYTINLKNKEIKRTLIVIFITIIGIYLNSKNRNVGLHYQTCLVILPFIHIGQLARLYLSLKMHPNIIISMLTFAIAILCLLNFEGSVELSYNQIWNPLIFYGLGVFLIYMVYTFCFYIEKLLHKTTIVLEYIGKNTFQIMCLHILSFKILDYFAINLFTKNYDILSSFTVSYPIYAPVYVFVGITLPLLLVYILRSIKALVLKK